MALVLIGSALLFTGIGVGLALAVDPLLGGAFVVVGLVDLAMALLFRRRTGTAEADSSYNPYARED